MFRVLIVDDEIPFVNHLLGFAWEKVDCQCVGVAYHGQQALEMCRTLMPHIVVTDVNMPVMDGISFIEQLHKDYSEIQTILLTAYKEFEYAQAALRLGSVDYVVKDSELETHLSQALEKACRAYASTPNRDLRERLLSRANKLLRLDALGGNQQQANEALQAFTKRHSGSYLLCVRLRRSAKDITTLIEQLDAWHHPNRNLPEVIVQDAALFEIVFDGGAGELKQWYQDVIKQQWPPMNDVMAAAWDGPVMDVDSYQKCRMRCLYTLKKNFYTGGNELHQAKEGQIQSLPAAISEEWIRQLEMLGGKKEDVRHYLLEKVALELKRRQPDPEYVREMLERWIRRYELKFAPKPFPDAREKIRLASCVDEAIEVFLSAIFQLLPEEGCASYALLEAVSFIREHLHDSSLQLSDVAAHVSMSPGYLSKKFKEELQLSYQEMLIRLRMERAAELLRKPGMRVYEVAEMCGYSNYRSFEKAFVGYYGKSPKKF